MGLLDVSQGLAWYTVRSHYFDPRSKRYVYKWQPARWVDNFTALSWPVELHEKMGLDSEHVLFQWSDSNWQRIA